MCWFKIFINRQAIHNYNRFYQISKMKIHISQLIVKTLQQLFLSFKIQIPVNRLKFIYMI